MPDATPDFMYPDNRRVYENLRLMKMIDEDRAWALSRVQAAATAEAEVERLREALENTMHRAYSAEGAQNLALEREERLREALLRISVLAPDDEKNAVAREALDA